MKILILRFSSMGDIILATPVLDVLKRDYPNSEIDWVVNKKFEDAVNTNPLINKLMIFKDKFGLKKIKDDISATNYDFIFDLHKNSKTNYLTKDKKNVYRYNKRVFDRFMLVHFKKSYKEILPVTKMYFYALEKAGIETSGKWKLRFGLVKDIEIKTVNKYDLHNLNYIAIIPGASYTTKMWPKEYFKELVNKIISSKSINKKIIIIGKGSAEEALGKFISEKIESDCIDLTGKLNLQETAAVLKYADLVVTNDNGPMHLAECFNKKIIAVFGSTTEEFGFFPYSTKYKAIENLGLKCRPCTHFGRKKCPKGHFKCMMDILPEAVYQEVIELLK
ncbi:MAG: glycosyltransferase family 9 protein [Candidatus Delongbacteria bacterium]|nr:glycosyltransferase family 9 protein [Candidatus Delongbacteria bacterium]MCG2760634.1 glycosyltransferase family 9 protein [Candidatus Delongbacteria bacterium]